MLSTSNKAKIVRSVVGCVPVDVMQYDCRRAAARLVLPEDEGEVKDVLDSPSYAGYSKSMFPVVCASPFVWR
jgi:hypothetical protein